MRNHMFLTTCYRDLGHIIILLSLALIGLVFAGCSEDEGEGEHNPKEELSTMDVSYGDDPLQTLDLRLPAMRTSKTRMVVFIHGGGWREGSKDQFDSFIGQFVQAGLATASINYRHANVDEGILYTDLLSDIDNALLYLRNEAGNYVYNGNDIVLMGHSAGAHLGLLYAYRNNERKQVTSVIAVSAPTDLKELMEDGIFPELIYNLVGSDDASKYIDASPVSHVKPGIPRTLIMHGKKDTSVPISQSEELYSVVSQTTPAVKLRLIDDAGHDFSEETIPIIVTESINFSKNQ